MKRILIFGLLGGILVVGSGCGLTQAIFCYRPCVMQGDSSPDYGGTCGEECDEGCGPSWGPTRAPAYSSRRAVVRDDCGVGCGRPCRGTPCGRCDSCDPCSDPCGDGCYARCWHRGPLSCLFALLFRGTWCGSGCGERYWGDFYGDPPDCWDPCDCHGNYTGGACRTGNCRQTRRGNQFGGTYMDYGMSEGDEQIISETDGVVSPSPSPSPSPTPATKPNKAAKRPTSKLHR